MKVTIMGLGVNGGGLESARYLALKGAECTITDMKDQKTLAASIEELEKLSGSHPPFRYVLGRHEMGDFSKADMVVKNPAIRPDSPYLAAASLIETDISLFLAASPARLIAVTGTKGKSVTASAAHWVLHRAKAAGGAFLGGNITVSPLAFLDKLTAEDDVVLELSSWQLGDLKGRVNDKGRPLLKPRAAILTAIMPDHMDRYSSLDAYVDDKRLIYSGQDKEDATIACIDDHWGAGFLNETPGRGLPYSEKPFTAGKATAAQTTVHSAWIDPQSGAGMVSCKEGTAEAVPAQLLVRGRHNKKNCLAAALALADIGVPASIIRESLGSFPGIEHRLEFVRETRGVSFYNDSAATIPEAAAAAIEAFTGGHEPRLVLVTGGTDKNLDFRPLAAMIEAKRELLDIILLPGTGSDKLIPLLKGAGIPYHGPYDSLEKAAQAAERLGRVKTPSDVVLSPGCTSFGMFANEFDRGQQWKDAVCRL